MGIRCLEPVDGTVAGINLIAVEKIDGAQIGGGKWLLMTRGEVFR